MSHFPSAPCGSQPALAVPVLPPHLHIWVDVLPRRPRASSNTLPACCSKAGLHHVCPGQPPNDMLAAVSCTGASGPCPQGVGQQQFLHARAVSPARSALQHLAHDEPRLPAGLLLSRQPPAAAAASCPLPTVTWPVSCSTSPSSPQSLPHRPRSVSRLVRCQAVGALLDSYWTGTLLPQGYPAGQAPIPCPVQTRSARSKSNMCCAAAP